MKAGVIALADGPEPFIADAIAGAIEIVNIIALINDLGDGLLSEPDAPTITTNDSKEKSESGPKLKDLKKISNGRMRQLKKGGFNPENAKKGEKMGGKEDLFTDKKGDIFVGAKDGTGEATPTGENIKDFLE